MAIHGKVIIILLLLIALSACSSKDKTEIAQAAQAPVEAKPSQVVEGSDNGEYEISDKTPDLQTDCIRIYDVEDFIDSDDPTPTYEIRDPDQISSIINSVDFSKWEKVGLEDQYSAEPNLCVIFNDNATIVMEKTVPERYGYLCKGIRSDKENDYYHIDNPGELCVFNDAFWEMIHPYLIP